jgi:uncharacterized protein
MDPAPKSPVPVFPLPDLVLFPGAVAPLHVFELRYRTLVREALSGERLLALAVLKPGWRHDYHGSPAFHELGCLASFEEVEWLPNDCYDLRVRGLARVRFGAVAREFPYRAARVETLDQAPLTEDDPLVLSERAALLAAWAKVAGQPLTESPLLPSGDVTYASLVSAACMALPASGDDKLAWLALDSVIERGARVRAWMERAASAGAPSAGEPPAGDWN